jgi:hypothetical protein
LHGDQNQNESKKTLEKSRLTRKFRMQINSVRFQTKRRLEVSGNSREFNARGHILYISCKQQHLSAQIVYTIISVSSTTRDAMHIASRGRLHHKKRDATRAATSDKSWAQNESLSLSLSLAVRGCCVRNYQPLGPSTAASQPASQ